jgi:DNA-binding CsgD family transcriptional regulator
MADPVAGYPASYPTDGALTGPPAFTRTQTLSAVGAKLYWRLVREQFVLLSDPEASPAVVDELVELQLAMRRGGRIMPLDPVITMRQTVAGAQAHIGAAVEVVLSLAAEMFDHAHIAGASAGSMRPLIEFLGDSRPNGLLTSRLRQAARDEVLTLSRAGQPLWENHGPDPSAATGVTARTVLEAPVLSAPGTEKMVKEVEDGGEAVRVVATLPLRMFIVDRRFAYVGLEPRGLQPAVLVHASALVEGFIDYFERIWRVAIPVSGSPDGGHPPPVQQRILQMLATGLTDDAMSRRLCLSNRTIRRHVADLLVATGANTRFECAVKALQNGWLTIPT